MCRKGYPLRYSGGAPSAPGDRQRARFLQVQRFRAESGALAHIRRGNCTEVDTPLCRYGRLGSCSVRVKMMSVAKIHGTPIRVPMKPMGSGTHRTRSVGDRQFGVHGLGVDEPVASDRVDRRYPAVARMTMTTNSAGTTPNAARMPI